MEVKTRSNSESRMLEEEGFPSSLLEEKRTKINKEDYLSYIEKEYGTIVAEMNPGTIFGEKALVDNKPRAATIITKSDCEFLVIEKKDFELILNKFKKI